MKKNRKSAQRDIKKDKEEWKEHMQVKARIEVKLSCDVIFMFCDVLLYQMDVKYQKFRLLR